MPLELGNYSVRQTINNCQSELSEPFNFKPTAIETLEEFVKIEVYPTPADEFIHVEIERFQGEVQIELIDLKGVTVFRSGYRVSDTRNLINLDVSHIKNGTFLMYISGKNLQIKRKVILK